MKERTRGWRAEEGVPEGEKAFGEDRPPNGCCTPGPGPDFHTAFSWIASAVRGWGLCSVLQVGTRELGFPEKRGLE